MNQKGMKEVILQVERHSLAFPPVSWLVTALEFTGSRAMWIWGRIRFGARVQNRGLGCVCHWSTDLKYPENLTLGNDVVIGVNVSLGAHSPIRLGDRVRLSRDVVLETAGLDFDGKQAPYAHLSKPILIDDDVWIGTRAMILGGVHIGTHAIIAAGALVTKDIPPYGVAAGVPARVVKMQARLAEMDHEVP